MTKEINASYKEYRLLVEQFKSECRDARIFSSIVPHGDKRLFSSVDSDDAYHTLDSRLAYHGLLALGNEWCDLGEYPSSQGEFMLHWADPGPGYVLWPLDKAKKLSAAFKGCFTDKARYFSNIEHYTVASGGANFWPQLEFNGTCLCIAVVDKNKIGIIAIVEGDFN